MLINTYGAWEEEKPAFDYPGAICRSAELAAAVEEVVVAAAAA